MKTLMRAVAAAVGTFPAAAWAAESTKGGGMSWLAIAFLAFFAALILFQLIPAVVLFGSMVVAVFSRKREAGKEAEAAGPR